MPHGQEFNPDWASAPGDTISDILHERNLTVIEFAHRMGDTTEHATDLLQGRATITIGIARRLERVLGASVEFWMSRDFQYRQDSARLHAPDHQWLAELPLGDMIQFGWLKPVPRPSDEMSACLRFFDVPSVAAWHQVYANLQEMVAFRTSRSFDSRLAAVAAWLRQGEIEGGVIECSPWDRNRFEECLSRIRPLTRQKDPSRFIPELLKLCRACGVAVVIVRAPNGCRASGATRFLSRDKALLLLSFRHLSDDQFWFSFFHEAAHLLLHGDKGFFLEGLEPPTTILEEEANEFAGRILVPSEFRTAMLGLPVHSREVIRFARRLGVSPGILVGQLQHFEKIKRNQLNGLKRRFRWGH
jgi:HTH-type transcriptional regulator/antitoxin HigA